MCRRLQTIAGGERVWRGPVQYVHIFLRSRTSCPRKSRRKESFFPLSGLGVDFDGIHPHGSRLRLRSFARFAGWPKARAIARDHVTFRLNERRRRPDGMFSKLDTQPPTSSLGR